MTWSPTEIRQNIRAINVGETARETLLLMVDALEEERDRGRLRESAISRLEDLIAAEQRYRLEAARPADPTAPPSAPWSTITVSDGPYRVSPLDGRTILSRDQEAIAVVSQRHNVTPGNAALLAASWDLYLALSGFVQDIQAKEDWRDQIGVLVSGEHWARAVATLNRLRGLEG